MINSQFQWEIKTFDNLTSDKLYAILRLRSEVFVVEQRCIFLDIDNRDQSYLHVMGWKGKSLAAYARLADKGITYREMSIGRVVTSPAYRNIGAGKELMKTALEKCYECFGRGPVKIGAQLYLKKFYGSFGFLQTSDVYLEDGIKHIEMVKNS
jgi:ElaA protein